MPESNNGNEPRPSLADAINAVMSDPSIIKGAIEALKKSGLSEPPSEPEASPDESGDKAEEASLPVTQDTSELIRSLSPMLSLLSGQPSHSEHQSSEDADRRSALLVALRPYLSESRREAIDYIIKISKVTDLIKKAGR